MDSVDTGVWEDGDGGLMARRKRLRAFVDTVLDTMEALPTPDTYLEAERALKAAKAADKVYTQLNNAPRRPNWTDYDPRVRDSAAYQTSSPKPTPVWSFDPDLDDDEREALGMGRVSATPSAQPEYPPARRRPTLGDLDVLVRDTESASESVQTSSEPPLAPTKISPSSAQRRNWHSLHRRTRYIRSRPVRAYRHTLPHPPLITQPVAPRLRANHHPP